MAPGFIRRHPAWSWSLGILLLIVALALIVLPRFIHLGLERWLERQGGISAEIENVDFNPFTGKLVVQTLIAQREEAPGRLRWERASLNIGWWPLLEQHLKLESLDLRDAIVTIRREGETLYIGGLKIRTGDSAGKDEKDPQKQNGWQFGFEDVDLHKVRVRYLAEGFEKEFLVQEAHIGSMAGWNPDDPGALRARIRAAEGSLILDGQARPFAQQPAFEARLTVDSVHLDWFRPWLRQTPLDVEQARLFTDLTVDGRFLPDPGRLRVQADGSVRLDQIRGQVRQFRLTETDLSWDGRLEVTAPRFDTQPLVVAAGTLQSSGIDLHLTNRQLAIRSEEAKLELSCVMGAQKVPPETDFLLTLSGTAADVSLIDAEKELVLASWGDLQVEKLHLEGARSFSLSQLTAVDLRLLERREKEPLPYYLQAARLEFAGLQGGSAGSIGAKRLTSQKLRILVVRDEEGLDLSPWSLPEGKNVAEEKEEPIPELRVGLLDIGGGSRVVIRDRSLQPALRLDLDPLRIHLENLDTRSQSEKPARIDIALEANGHPLAIAGKAQVSGEKLSATGQVKLQEWPVSLLQPYLGQKATLENGLASLDSRIEVAYDFSEDRLSLQTDGSARLGEIHGEMGGLRLQRLSLDWTGQAAFETVAGGGAKGEKSKPSVTARGNVQAPRFALVLPGKQLRIEGETVLMQGDFAMGTGAVPRGARFLLQAGGSVASLRAEDREKGLNLALVRDIELVRGRMEGPERMSADRVRISEIRLLERPGETEAGGPHFLSAAPVILEKPRKTDSVDLAMAGLEVQGLEGILVREANGDFPFGKWIPQEKEEEEKEPLRLRIGRIDFSGAKSRLRYLDRSVEPFVDLELQPFRATLSDLNTTGEKPGSVEIDGEFGKYSNLRLNGTLLSLQDKPTMDLFFEVESLSLPKLSGYTEKLFGYAARSGNLDVKADIKVNEGELDAETDWVLTKLNLDAVDPEKRKETSLFLGFSLQTAVSLLREGDGVIKLEIPVTGEVTSPEFQFSDVIQKAVLKGVRSAALAYFSPLGLAAKLGKELLLDKIMEMRFRPVLFAPGEAEITAENRRYLNEVVRRLRERPKVTIVVCGVIVTEDIQALRPEDPSGQEMLELAKKRGEKVRDYLIEQGISSERLVQCAPDMDRSEKAEPRAEIGI